LFGGPGFPLGLGSNNVINRLYIDTMGNVGIGTTAPSQKLHVVGNIVVTGCIKDGAGNVLAGTCV